MPTDPENGDRYILVVVDHYSKFTWALALDQKDTSRISAFLERIFLEEGVPTAVVSDNGSELKNALMTSILEAFDVVAINGRVEHPQTQGVVERRNGFIKRVVRAPVFACAHKYILIPTLCTCSC